MIEAGLSIDTIATSLPTPVSSNSTLSPAKKVSAATAPFWPSVQSYCADRMPETDTTMLFILLSCAGIPGCGVFTWLMGFLGNINGDLSLAFYLIPGCYLVLAGLIGYDWWRTATRLAPRPE